MARSGARLGRGILSPLLMTQVVETPTSGTRSDQPANSTGSSAGAIGAPARGKVIEARPGLVIFQPRGTNYELHLETAGDYQGPVSKPIQCLIHVKARKLYTVPSGGNFIAPILGPPRTIQGRVVAISPTQIVLQAGAPIVVDLPAEEHAIDLGSGPIQQGAIVNVVAFPGARFLPVSQ